MNSSILTARLAAVILLFPALCYSQRLDDIKTEADWDQLFYDQYFDYGSYQLFRELAEGAAVIDTAQFIRSVLGLPAWEMTDRMEPLDSAQIENGSDIFSSRKMMIKTGQRIHAGDNSGYYLISGFHNGISAAYKGRRGQGSWLSERRFVGWQHRKGRITLGNYSADLGLGLSIGRFDYRPINLPSLESTEAADNFLYPDNSFYNGAMVRYGGGSLLYSFKRYPGLNKYFLGSAASISHNEFIAGVTANGTILSSSGMKRRMGAFSIFLFDAALGIKSELAYAEAGPGAVVMLTRPGYYVSTWYYDNSFRNLNCSGPARPDYIVFEPDSSGLEFRQAQAGESGLSALKQVDIYGMQVQAAAEVWKRSASATVSHDNMIGARIKLGDGLNLSARLSERAGDVPHRFLAEFGVADVGPYIVSARCNLWSQHGHLDYSKSFGYIYGSFNLFDTMQFSSRMRWRFNGIFDFFLEETISPLHHVKVKATYRWQNSYDDLGPLYIIMEGAI